MKMLEKWSFHIIDNEYNDEYDFEGFFEDAFEADRFITENEHAGNKVIVLCLPQMVPASECP